MKYILSRSANKLISINTLCDICLTLKITCSCTVGWPGFAKIANSQHLQNLVILTYRILLCQDCYSEWVSTQLCPILCDSMECSLSGSSVHGVFPARILEWVAISSSRGYSWPRDQTRIACISYIAGRSFTTEPLGNLGLS